MIKFHLINSFILSLIFLSGCRSYDVLTIERKIKTDTNSGYNIIFYTEKNKVLTKKNTVHASHVYWTERYLTGKKITGPAGNIIKKGIEEALQGNFTEAEFLFKETGDLISDSSIQNNLAVVYEASERYDEAFCMYSRAILIAPDNNNLKRNFLLFVNQNYEEKKESLKKRKGN